MIKNEKQLSIANKKLQGLQKSRSEIDDKSAWQAYTDLIDDLSAQITEFSDVKSGQVKSFNLESLDALGEAIIKARISRGWTQKQFADEVGVSEQLIQKDEAREFENAGLARLAEMLDILGYELVGCVRPKQQRFVDIYEGESSSNHMTVHATDLTWLTAGSGKSASAWQLFVTSAVNSHWFGGGEFSTYLSTESAELPYMSDVATESAT